MVPDGRWGNLHVLAGSFPVIRELDSLGFDWAQPSKMDGSWVPHHAVEYAVAFGHADVLQWLWIRGAIPASAEGRCGILWERDAIFE
jgi:hypothetical protein